jgi:NADH-quinone oxidoreductase subunit A
LRESKASFSTLFPLLWPATISLAVVADAIVWRERRPMPVYFSEYFFIVLFIVLAVLLPIATIWVIGPMLRPHRPTKGKVETYESGVTPFGDTHVRYNARYYLFALMFVVFDVETLFLYPWAVSYHRLGLFALVEMLMFIVILAVGLIYAWRKKVLEWT